MGKKESRYLGQGLCAGQVRLYVHVRLVGGREAATAGFHFKRRVCRGGGRGHGGRGLGEIDEHLGVAYDGCRRRREADSDGLGRRPERVKGLLETLWVLGIVELHTTTKKKEFRDLSKRSDEKKSIPLGIGAAMSSMAARWV